MHLCTGIGIPSIAMPLEDKDHTHVHANLPSLSESALQNKNLLHAAAILFSMVKYINTLIMTAQRGII